MKIAIDTRPLVSGHSHRGIGTYTRLLISSLKTYSSITIRETSSPYKEKVDLVHYPYFDLFFLTLPFNKTKPTVTTIHDVIPLVLADHYPPGIRGNIKLWLQKHSLGNVAHIVTDSNSSTQDVSHLLNQRAEKVSTVYLAPDPGMKPATSAEIERIKKQYALNKPYFLYVGDINYNKNIPGLLRAFANLPRTLDLVIVSKALHRDNPAAAPIFEVLDKLDILNHVKILNEVTSEDLPGLYSGAWWYIQPSFYEGFGLPVLEAQACGCPVISTNGGSLRELLQSSALTSGDSPEEMSAALTQALDTDRDHVIAAGFANVNRFSWDKTTSAMVKIYQSLLS